MTTWTWTWTAARALAWLGAVAVAAVMVVSACDDDGGEAAVDLSVIVEAQGTRALMDYTLAGGFYAAPWPSEARRGADGRPDLAGFPDHEVAFVADTLAILRRDADGFGVSTMITFRMTGPVDAARLPDAAGSLADTSPVLLVSVDPGSPDHLRRYPIVSVHQADAGPFGATELLSLLPYQGVPLRSRTLYAAVVLRTLGDATGAPLGVPAELAAIAAGGAPAGMDEAVAELHRAALRELDAAGVDLADVAALTVFRTGDPRAAMATFRDDLLSRPLPEPKAPWTLEATYDGYCLYGSRLDFPTYQSGEPPFTGGGGGWRVDDAGRPILQGSEEGRLFVTVPRRAAPAAGYPIVVYVRAGGGADVVIADRGVRATAGGEAPAGTGPAVHFAAAGWAALQGDGPNGGLRNITGGDENTLLYPVTNPEALRDNLRQSALDQVLLANLLPTLSIDTSGCAGATSPATFDVEHVVIMGHSNGAWISPMALAVEPLFRGAILSGAGGSWTENLVYKKSPIDVKAIAQLLLGYDGREIHRHDPAINMLQWAGEPADPALYGAAVIDAPPAGAAPRHVLMFQGIVDTYILPTIAHASSLAIGLDLAGPALEASAPALAEFPTLPEMLPLVGRAETTLPASSNRTVAGGGHVTAVVVQYPQDAIEDGHEVMYQLEAPRRQYRCFLASLAAGAPRVPAAGALDAPCD